MKNFFLFFIILLFATCQDHQNKSETIQYFNKEIASRIESLQNLVISGDSMKIKTQLIDEEVANLILLSKDIENLSASVNRANSFFDALAAEFRLQLKDFTKLNTGMHVNEIEIILKQNELNLFNQIILKNTSGRNLMYTAQ